MSGIYMIESSTLVVNPVTNYDRIVSKTPEELARWIWAVQSGIEHEDIVSTDGWLDWLKQEATE